MEDNEHDVQHRPMARPRAPVGSEEKPSLNWLDLTAFAPRALQNALERLRAENPGPKRYAADADEAKISSGEEEPGNPTAAAATTRDGDRRKSGAGLRSALQARGGIRHAATMPALSELGAAAPASAASSSAEAAGEAEELGGQERRQDVEGESGAPNDRPNSPLLPTVAEEDADAEAEAGEGDAVEDVVAAAAEAAEELDGVLEAEEEVAAKAPEESSNEAAAEDPGEAAGAATSEGPRVEEAPALLLDGKAEEGEEAEERHEEEKDEEAKGEHEGATSGVAASDAAGVDDAAAEPDSSIVEEASPTSPASEREEPAAPEEPAAEEKAAECATEAATTDAPGAEVTAADLAPSANPSAPAAPPVSEADARPTVVAPKAVAAAATCTREAPLKAKEPANANKAILQEEKAIATKMLSRAQTMGEEPKREGPAPLPRLAPEPPRRATAEPGKLKELREFWGKNSVGFAGPQLGNTRLSKVEAEATLQRLIAAGGAVDFNEVRRLRKLIAEIQ